MLFSKISVAAAVKQVVAQVAAAVPQGGKGAGWDGHDGKSVASKDGLFGKKPVVKPIDPWGRDDDDDCDDRDGGKGKGHGKDDDRGKGKDRDDDRHHGRDRDDDDRDHGKDDDRDHGHGKDRDHGHGKDRDHGHGKGHDRDCRDDDDDDGDGGNAGSAFPDIPKDTTGITFHIDLNNDDGADEYYYVQKDPAVTKDMSFSDYYSAVKQDLAKDFPDKAPKDIVIKATIYSASEGESYYYFTGDEEEGGKDDDDKTCGWGGKGGKDWDWDFGKSFGKGGGLGCKIVAKAGNLKDFVNAKFMADLSAGREALDEDAPHHDDEDEDEDDDC